MIFPALISISMVPHFQTWSSVGNVRDVGHVSWRLAFFFEMGQAWEVARWENGGNGAWRLRQPHNLSMWNVDLDGNYHNLSMWNVDLDGCAAQYNYI
jgi:hypothetical protein